MKKLFVVFLLFLFSCSNPFAPDKADVKGTVQIYKYQKIKWGGIVGMEYNRNYKSTNLYGFTPGDRRNEYTFKFSGIKVKGTKKAVFIVKLKNGFGASKEVGRSEKMLSEGDNKIIIDLGVI